MTAPIAPVPPNALDPTLYVRGVAHDVFDWLRAHDPVHRDERNNIWVISKYDDVLPLLYEVGFRRVRSLNFDEACLDVTGTYDRDRKFRFQLTKLRFRRH